jgi:hypothetical protein
MNRGRLAILTATLLMLAGVTIIAGSLVLWTPPANAFRPLALGVATGGAALLVGTLLLGRAVRRQHQAALSRACAYRGLELRRLTRKRDKAAAFAPFEHIKQLNGGAGGLAWIATGRPHDPDPTLTIFEHTFATNIGGAPVPVTHTVAALDCPRSWPDLSLTAAHLGHRLAALARAPGLRLENESFNRRWHIRADDEDFATLVLTPEMQADLLGLPKHASVHIGQGTLTVIYKKKLKPEALADLARAVEGVMARIPPELDAWPPSD